jgi:BASS family bile acid:Na+ symporter
MYEQLLTLDHVRIHFSETGSLILNGVLAFIMFGVSLDIRPKEFIPLLRTPKPLLAGLLGQVVFLPLMTFALVIACNQWIPPTVAMGMILVAACPGGNISNFISNYAKGNIELSVSLAAITTVLALFTTPFNFAFYGDWYVHFRASQSEQLLQPLSIDPYQMFQTVCIVLGIPLLLGQTLVHFRPRMAKRWAPFFQKSSLVLFVGMIGIAFSNNVDIFLHYLFFIFFVVLVHNGCALLTGYLTGTCFGLSERDRRTTTIEVGIQNSGLGLALLLNPKIFPPNLEIGGMLVVTAWWGIWHIVSGLLLGTYWHFKPSKPSTYSAR